MVSRMVGVVVGFSFQTRNKTWLWTRIDGVVVCAAETIVVYRKNNI